MTGEGVGMQPLEDDLRIAANLRTIRSSRGLTLSQLSEISGVSMAHLSRLENGERTPTVRTMLQLARAYGVSLGELAGESLTERGSHVSRGADRSSIVLSKTALQSLSDPSSRFLQAFDLVLESGRKGDPAVHTGEEWIYVLEGRVEAVINGRIAELGPTDAVHFRAEESHYLRNVEAERAHVIIVSAATTAGLHLDA